jgi:hypothetical protein
MSEERGKVWIIGEGVEVTYDPSEFIAARDAERSEAVASLLAVYDDEVRRGAVPADVVPHLLRDAFTRGAAAVWNVVEGGDQADPKAPNSAT